MELRFLLLTTLLHLIHLPIISSLNRECEKILHHIQHAHVTSPAKPDPTGYWTSYRCEIRSGPEFLLRHYTFTNTTFYLIQYYYSDPDCSSPIYALVGEGNYKLVREAWSVPGGAEAEYTLTKVDLIPYDRRFSEQMEQKRGLCRDMAFARWQPYQKQTIYNFPSSRMGLSNKANFLLSDFDCLQLIHVSFHELQLMRLEHKVHRAHQYKFPRHKTPSKWVVEELFLGDVHTEGRDRATYRPTSYQVPLKRSKSPACGVCNSIANSNVNYPPELSERQGTVVNIAGEWASVRCECRPHAVFLTRHLSFNDEKRVWGGKYQFFHDPFCRHKSFTVHVTGRYTPRQPSHSIPGARHFRFTKIGAQVVPHDKKTVDNLNGYIGRNCGVAGSWRIDVPQDVTLTNGCETLGITVPHTARDLVKMEITETKERLFIGERPTGARVSKDNRPTSFQLPLIKCSSPLPVSLPFTKDKDRRHVPTITDKLKGNAANSLFNNCFVILLLLTFVVSC